MRNRQRIHLFFVAIFMALVICMCEKCNAQTSPGPVNRSGCLPNTKVTGPANAPYLRSDNCGIQYGSVPYLNATNQIVENSSLFFDGRCLWLNGVEMCPGGGFSCAAVQACLAAMPACSFYTGDTGFYYIPTAISYSGNVNTVVFTYATVTQSDNIITVSGSVNYNVTDTNSSSVLMQIPVSGYTILNGMGAESHTRYSAVIDGSSSGAELYDNVHFIGNHLYNYTYSYVATSPLTCGYLACSGGGGGGGGGLIDTPSFQSVTNAGNRTTNDIVISDMDIAGNLGLDFTVTPTVNATQTIFSVDSNGTMSVESATGEGFSLSVSSGLLQIGDVYTTNVANIGIDSVSTTSIIEIPNVTSSEQTMMGTISITSGAPSGLGGLGKFDIDLATHKLYFWNGSQWALITSVP